MSLALGLALWLFCVTGSVYTQLTNSKRIVEFKKLNLCPSYNNLTQLSRIERAQDVRSCFVSCALNHSCTALYRSINGNCYFLNWTQFTSLLNESSMERLESCISHVKTDALVNHKLVVLYNFKLGFKNVISPGIFDGTPIGVTVGEGVQFAGNISSYIEVDTQNGSLISNYLDHPHNFSFYAKVVRQTWYLQSYHYIYDCSSPSYAGRFGDRGGFAWIEHKFPNQFTTADQFETRASYSVPFATDNTPQYVSLGAVFNGYNLTNFYLNGSYLQATEDKVFLFSATPRCLRLGFDSDSSATLKGRMICYAIAKEALSVADFQQLDRQCPW